MQENRFLESLIWNYFSLAILAISGIALNVIIGLNYESSILGAFNQVLTIYFIFSMIGSVGINYSVLHSISKDSQNKEQLKSIIAGGFISVLITSLLNTIIFIISINPISRFLNSELIYDGMLLISPGLYFFSINKVLLNGIINGLNKMKAYAFFQSLRYLLILLGLFWALIITLEGSKLTIIFSFSEFLLFLILLFYLNRSVRWWQGKSIFKWANIHTKYGFKSFVGSILIEINPRVDILMIGFYLSDTNVGIYSFSALFAEGFFQLLIVMQNIYNPILSRNVVIGKKKLIENFIRTGIRNSYLLIIPIGILSIIFYPLILGLLTNKSEYVNGVDSFRVLILGICLISGFVPFYNIFSMSNLPWIQSVFMLKVVLVNIISNLILIPIFGIFGAALGTFTSLVASIIIFKYLTKRKLGLEV